jgi:hypothetical protein
MGLVEKQANKLLPPYKFYSLQTSFVQAHEGDSSDKASLGLKPN